MRWKLSIDCKSNLEIIRWLASQKLSAESFTVIEKYGALSVEKLCIDNAENKRYKMSVEVNTLNFHRKSWNHSVFLLNT